MVIEGLRLMIIMPVIKMIDIGDVNDGDNDCDDSDNDDSDVDDDDNDVDR